MEELNPQRRALRIVDVKFRVAGSTGGYDAGQLELAVGDRVVVESPQGATLGIVAAPPHPAPPQAVGGRTLRVLKKADERDLAREDSNRRREKETHRLCAELVRTYRLPMKLVKVEYSFDSAKAVVYFFAEDRVDFRGLVRDLTNQIRVRIEMKQIGARDETKLVGAVGPCGRELCCSSWLKEFHTVSVKMAKEQDLSLNPSKLAGMCGRLKCCLRYEYETYLELKRALPRVGARVASVKGDGIVVRQLPIRERVVVRRDDDGAEVEATLEDLVQKKADA